MRSLLKSSQLFLSFFSASSFLFSKREKKRRLVKKVNQFSDCKLINVWPYYLSIYHILLFIHHPSIQLYQSDLIICFYSIHPFVCNESMWHREVSALCVCNTPLAPVVLLLFGDPWQGHLVVKIKSMHIYSTGSSVFAFSSFCFTFSLLHMRSLLTFKAVHVPGVCLFREVELS